MNLCATAAAFCTCALLQACGATADDTPASNRQVLSCYAPHVADGDTITCAGQRVRIFGVNSPEIAHPDLGIAEEPGGQAASARMFALTRARVWCAPAGDQWDRYGRMVGKCWTAATPDLGAEMLREGLACEWTRYDRGAYAGVGRVCSRRGK